MVMSDPLLLVMSMLNSLGFGFDNALSDTNGQIGSDGATDVAVGVNVLVGVELGVGVEVDVEVGVFVRVGVAVGVFVRVGVAVGVFVRVGVPVRVGVLVGPGVLVGFGRVTVAVSVGFFEGVVLGSTTSVYVAGRVGEGVCEIVGEGIMVGVEVIALWIWLCACSSVMGLISSGVQNSPVIVQAIVNSVPVIASGSEGALMASVPFSPPS